MQDLVCQICVTIADKGAAEFAVGSLIVELISSDGNWEAIIIGLKALLSIYMAAPARAAGKNQSNAQVHTLHVSSPACLRLLLCIIATELLWRWNYRLGRHKFLRQCHIKQQGT